MSAQKFKTKAGLQVATSALLECTTTAQTVLPQANTTYNIGSTAMTYSNMYATTFNGRATAANWSDLAEKYQADKKHGVQMTRFHEEYTHRIESLENEIEGLRKDLDDKTDKINEHLLELKHKL